MYLSTLNDTLWLWLDKNTLVGENESVVSPLHFPVQLRIPPYFPVFIRVGGQLMRLKGAKRLKME
jgi:hypothetical protein